MQVDREFPRVRGPGGNTQPIEAEWDKLSKIPMSPHDPLIILRYASWKGGGGCWHKALVVGGGGVS